MTPYAVVVVLHRSHAELARLLPTVRAAQLIVVDTGPDDGGAQLARDHGAELIERRDNPGFGAANNLALERVTQPVTILMNPDVIVHGDADRYVPIDLSRRLIALDHAAGGASSLVELPQVGHFALIDPETATWSEVTTALRSLH